MTLNGRNDSFAEIK